MKTLKKQNGLSMWGWLVVGSMIVILGYQASLLMSPYWNNILMDKILDDMPIQSSKSQARLYIAKTASRENIDSFKEKEHLEFKNTKGGFSILINFEQRVNIFGNLDFVVRYNREVAKGSRL